MIGPLFLYLCTLRRASASPTEVSSALLTPCIDAAAERGPQIFNAVFDSLRKYGSTLHPNGMSFFFAVMPEGVLLQHGNGRNATPTSFDWVSYEIEHSEIFARPPYHRPKHRAPEQTIMGDLSTYDFGASEEAHGWLHTYRTTKELHFLYIDGMSGNKDDTGVIDSQDYILRADSYESSSPHGPNNEFQRATELCELCAEMGLQGVIRTENPGNEIIVCDFFDGLEEVQSIQRQDRGASHDTLAQAWFGGPGRDAGEWPGRDLRYDFEAGFRDVGSHRTTLDYSHMVSAFFYDVNLTNPNTDPVEKNLPRLVETTPNERQAMKEHLKEAIKQARSAADKKRLSLSWRDVADLIVRRYAQPLSVLVQLPNSTTADEYNTYVQALLNVVVDYSESQPQVRETMARQRCSQFYLKTQSRATESDELIYAAFEATTTLICTTLFDIADILTGGPGPGAPNRVSGDENGPVSAAKCSIARLMQQLDWSVFEREYQLPQQQLDPLP